MGAVPRHLARQLKRALNLERAVETGTFRGEGARRLAQLFPQVVTIELSPRYHETAISLLRHVPNVECRLGPSVEFLPELAREQVPTLYWLDAHWCTGASAGSDDQCPLLPELEAIGSGNPNDCLLIDDARLFAAAPPPPHIPEQWPTLVQVFDKIRSFHPDHHVTIASDMVIAVPITAKTIVDDFARHPARDWPLLLRAARHLLTRALARVETWANEM